MGGSGKFSKGETREGNQGESLFKKKDRKKTRANSSGRLQGVFEFKKVGGPKTETRHV